MKSARPIRDANERLIARQDALQAEATAVLADLDLIRVLGAVGRPIQTGSSVLGLMVRPDIDVTTLCPVLEPAAMFEAVRPLVSHPRVHRLSFRNDTGRWNTDPAYPDGLYWMLAYRTEAGVDSNVNANPDWNLDLWFLREGTTQFDLQHIVSMPPRLSREARLAIMRIKGAWQARPAEGARVRSYEIYEAVLDHGVTSPEEFSAYLRERARPA
ncbi:MAG: hypothetical protein M3P84_00455 [Chloroflexota bacterium]|nr:hypothetical protein [Chloroflexota bacterium]